MALDAMVVLGCRVGERGLLSGAARRRVQRAALAYESGLAPLVITSGGKAWSGVAEADAFAAHLIELGVPEPAIARELASRTTLENARYVARLARERGFLQLGIVTCDWHMRRALAAFSPYGFGLEPVPAPSPERGFAVRTLRDGLERTRALVGPALSRLLDLTSTEPKPR